MLCHACACVCVCVLGAGLSVCSVTTAQCCTQEFLDRVQGEVKKDLLKGLRDQIKGRMNGLRNIFDRLASCE